MNGNVPNLEGVSDIQQELHGLITELSAGDGLQVIGPDEDLIKRGIVDSLGVQQLVNFCETRYGIRVDDDDLVPENFQTLRKLAAYIDRKQRTTSAQGRKGARWGRG